MYAIEFQTSVQNGIIKIPKRYQTNMPSRVRVIILADKSDFSDHKKENMIARLLK